jgi:hypothetical protein
MYAGQFYLAVTKSGNNLRKEVFILAMVSRLGPWWVGSLSLGRTSWRSECVVELFLP